MVSHDLPALDTHAHIATDVTSAQAKRLGSAVVFAVTRSLSEAASVPHGCYPNLVWGLGVHPADRQAQTRFDPERLDRLIPRFALIGEIGLDRRAGSLPQQVEIFEDILRRIADAPVMSSIHSSGALDAVVDLLESTPVRGPILHWFNGSPQQLERAVAAGAWFSVNAAMRSETLSSLPRDHVLTETDFPYTRRAGAARPGDTATIESRLADLWGHPVSAVRERIWQNLQSLVEKCGVHDRLPKDVRRLLE